MSPNHHQPHLLVIPEDKANQDVVNGFLLQVESNERQLHVLNLANGWLKGRNMLLSLSEGHLKKFTNAHALLLIDHDGYPARGSEIKAQISDEIKDRVFVIGVLSEPEELKSANQKYEQIGKRIADGCKENNSDFWQQELLVHNLEEVQRLSEAVHNLFFPGSENTN
jgi:hypothetical protein